MTLHDARTYTLLQLSAEICRNCMFFRNQEKCPPARDFDRNDWSAFKVCNSWSPDDEANEALQVLTMRKLEGREIVPPVQRTDE